MNKKSIFATLVAFSAIGVASAEAPLQVEGSVSANAGSGDFAPYFMMANRGGTLTQPKAVELRVKALKDFDLSERFSYGFGADLVGGYQSKYTQYDQAVNTPAVQGHHPNAIWLQQLYGEVKYRGVYLSVGMKERTSPLMNDCLGVGDYTQSNNARPLPQVRAGFVDFQNIPFTNGWVQIQGEIAYGYYMQDDWFEDHFNYYSGYINTGEYYNYKRCYFRTKPSKPFSVTVGMQMVTEFGGTATSYSYDRDKGKVNAKEDRYDTTWKDFVRAFFASEGGSNPGDASYHYGNTLGSWDFVARYRLKDKSEIKAFFQKPFEDGSGIGWMNGFDGIWGLEYKNAKKGIVNGAVLEYVDFTNQSGPMHWAPHDHPSTKFTDQVTGGDSYYQNFRCNPYSNFGMSQGTMFIPSTIYDRRGENRIYDNRVRGFQIGVSGNIYAPLEYRLLVNYRKSWGTYSNPRLSVVDNTSFMLEGTYHFKQVKGLTLNGQVAFDKGALAGGDNFGVLLSVKYNGLFDIFKR